MAEQPPQVVTLAALKGRDLNTLTQSEWQLVLTNLPESVRTTGNEMDRLISYITQAQPFTSWSDLEKRVTGMGSGRRKAIERMRIVVRRPTTPIPRVDVPLMDPLLAGASTPAERRTFHEQYELRAYDPNRLIPALGIVGYLPSEEFQRIALTAMQHVMEDVRRAIRQVKSSRDPRALDRPILTPFDDPKIAAELTRQVLDMDITPFIVECIQTLPRHERRFFLDFVTRHLPPNVARDLTRLFSAPDQVALMLAASLDSGQVQADVRGVGYGLKFLVATVYCYKVWPLAAYQRHLEQLQPFLHAATTDGTLILKLLHELYGGTTIFGEEPPVFWLASEEGRVLADTLTALNPALRFQISATEDWLRDRRSYLTTDASLAVIDKHREQRRGPIGQLGADEPGAPSATKLDVGGAVIPGRARTPFVLIAEAVSELERRVLAWELQDRGVRVYSLPAGFLTYDLGGQRYWFPLAHLDTSINVIGAGYTLDGRAKLLVDPLYYGGVRHHPEFQRLLAEQGFGEEDVVIIDEAEAGLNLANFTEIPTPDGQTRLVFNPGLETLKRLHVKENVIVTLPIPLQAVSWNLGVQRCLTQLFLPEELAEHSFVNITLRSTLPRQLLLAVHSLFRTDRRISGYVKVLGSGWLMQLEIGQNTSSSHLLLLDQEIPVRASLVLPNDVTLETLPTVLQQGLERVRERLAAMWAGRLALPEVEAPPDSSPPDRFQVAMDQFFLRINNQEFDSVRTIVREAVQILQDTSDIWGGQDVTALQFYLAPMTKFLDDHQEKVLPLDQAEVRSFYHLGAHLVRTGDKEAFLRALRSHAERYPTPPPRLPADLKQVDPVGTAL